jgi:hypothetical protein
MMPGADGAAGSYKNQSREHLFMTALHGKDCRRFVGGSQKGDRKGQGSVQVPSPPRRWKMQQGGSWLPCHHPVVEKNTGHSGERCPSKASEWELREVEERDEVRRRRHGEIGAEVEDRLEFRPTLFASLVTIEEETEEWGEGKKGTILLFFLLTISFVIFLCNFLGAAYITSG